jgi:hypothetical protein
VMSKELREHITTMRITSVRVSPSMRARSITATSTA